LFFSFTASKNLRAISFVKFLDIFLNLSPSPLLFSPSRSDLSSQRRRRLPCRSMPSSRPGLSLLTVCSPQPPSPSRWSHQLASSPSVVRSQRRLPPFVHDLHQNHRCPVEFPSSTSPVVVSRNSLFSSRTLFVLLLPGLSVPVRFWEQCRHAPSAQVPRASPAPAIATAIRSHSSQGKLTTIK
jgi:hypothetical protein